MSKETITRFEIDMKIELLLIDGKYFVGVGRGVHEFESKELATAFYKSKLSDLACQIKIALEA